MCIAAVAAEAGDRVQLNLQGAVLGRRVRTTIPDGAGDRPQDLVARNFTATRRASGSSRPRSSTVVARGAPRGRFFGDYIWVYPRGRGDLGNCKWHQTLRTFP